MNVRDIYDSKAIALKYSEPESNAIPYLGEALFPKQKRTSIDLKWFKASKGLPISLMPSAFDTVSTIRSRGAFSKIETEMPYFKESMIMKEQDEIDIMRMIDSTDPFAPEIVKRIYDDANDLVLGADVVPERMIWQLLTNEEGKPSISIAYDNATYDYNYDPDGTYNANNFLELSGTDKWSDTTNSDPLADIEAAQDKIEEETGVRPTRLVVSRATMNYFRQNETLNSYYFSKYTTAVGRLNDDRVKALFNEELGITIYIYTKRYKDEDGVAHKFMPDGMAVLLPDFDLGTTWYGMTPDERTLTSGDVVDTTLVGTGVAVTVTRTSDPVHTKTTVSEIVLPSYENIDYTYQIKCY